MTGRCLAAANGPRVHVRLMAFVFLSGHTIPHFSLLSVPFRLNSGLLCSNSTQTNCKLRRFDPI
jgi:hypothetical protein